MLTKLLEKWNVFKNPWQLVVNIHTMPNEAFYIFKLILKSHELIQIDFVMY